MSFYTGMNYEKKLGGIAILCGYFSDSWKLDSFLDQSNKNTKIMCVHGKRDQVVNIDTLIDSLEYT